VSARSGSAPQVTIGGFTLVARTRLGQCVIYARLDVALGLTANGREFRNDKVMRALEHPLLAE
jgi:hypothetical protein